MKKNKVLIQIFPMVTDIDYLERTLLLLKQNSVYVDKSKFYIILDVTYPLSDYFVDWDNSILKKDFFLDKFENLKKYGDWADESYFNIDEEIKGCVDYCVNNINKYDVDDAIWLDTDIVFNPYTLNLILESSLEIKSSQSKYIITPECVKLWDNSWDILTNNQYASKPYGYEKNNDSITDVMDILGEISLEPLVWGNEKLFKFGGSWFTLYSKELLDSIDFPKDLKGYSPIDTFIMTYSKYFPEITQFKIKNLVICEDYKHTPRTTYSKYLKTIDRKLEYFNSSWEIMINHLQNKLNK